MYYISFLFIFVHDLFVILLISILYKMPSKVLNEASGRFT